MNIQFDSAVKVSNDVMIRQVGNESVLLDLKTERYLGLDDVSSRFWEALTSKGSIKDAYDTLLSEFDVAPERLEQDLGEFVQELVDLGLVEINRS